MERYSFVKVAAHLFTLLFVCLQLTRHYCSVKTCSEQGSYANHKLPSHCCNKGIFQADSPRCFPYTIACQLTQPVVGYTAWDTALKYLVFLEVLGL